MHYSPGIWYRRGVSYRLPCNVEDTGLKGREHMWQKNPLGISGYYYDYAGSWDTSCGHQSNLYANPNNPASTPYSTNVAVESYLCAGVPASKIVLGIPLYGRSFEATGGLGGAYTGVGQGSWEEGVWDYKVLPRQGATELYDKVADASYSYNNVSRELINYDNVPNGSAFAGLMDHLNSACLRQRPGMWSWVWCIREDVEHAVAIIP
ncbi:glycosyl hydrolases family 18-domain-containing protein [Hypoxylon crocopeplum]|nr:glycosyl hydrolases family 18-domain-containing protein [Hypoxylon crocopeplum]